MSSLTIPQLVIAGGPGAGKDDIIRRILLAFPGLFHLLGETAGMMIRTHRLEPPFMGGDLVVWQTAIAQTQIHGELMGQIMARRLGGFPLCNRGVPDGAGYLPGGFAEFLALVGGTAEEYFGRYDQVIFLETTNAKTYRRTTAPGTPGYNPDRFETAAQARARGRRLKSVWTMHPNCDVIPAMPTIEEKSDLANERVAAFLRRHGRL